VRWDGDGAAQIHGPPGVQHLQGVFNRVIGQKRNLFLTYNPMGFDGEYQMPGVPEHLRLPASPPLRASLRRGEGVLDWCGAPAVSQRS
jgi:hypothetical protein